MERIEQDRREAQDDEAEELRAEEQAIARAEAEKQQRGKYYQKRRSGTRMEHCSYRHSDFYWLFSLLMHCMESQLSNKPKSVYTKKNQIVENVVDCVIYTRL
jgi:hypothetical protein